VWEPLAPGLTFFISVVLNAKGLFWIEGVKKARGIPSMHMPSFFPLGNSSPISKKNFGHRLENTMQILANKNTFKKIRKDQRFQKCYCSLENCYHYTERY
jgi:hypothetical protein